MSTERRICRLARLCMDLHEDGCPIPVGTWKPLIVTLGSIKLPEGMSMPTGSATESQKYEFLKELVGRFGRPAAAGVVYDA
jgi:hypothetical protein